MAPLRRRVVWQPVADTQPQWCAAVMASDTSPPDAAPIVQAATIAITQTSQVAAWSVEEVEDVRNPVCGTVAATGFDDEAAGTALAKLPRSKRGSGIIRPGDWSCGSCGLNVFASRNTCFKCGASRCGNQAALVPQPAITVKAGSGGSAADVRPGDWPCPGCGLNVFASKMRCFKCGACRDDCRGSSALAPRGNSRPHQLAETESTEADQSDCRLSAADVYSDTASSDLNIDGGSKTRARDTKKEATSMVDSGPRYSQSFLLAARRHVCEETELDPLPANALRTDVRPKEPPRRASVDSPSSRGTSQQSKVEVCSTPNSWVTMQRQRRLQPEAEIGESVNDASIARSAKSILNKLTPERFDVLCGKLIQCGIEAGAHGELLANLIFEAVMQHSFAGMYADLCVRLMEEFGEKGYLLRDALLAQCWQAFDPLCGADNLNAATWYIEGAASEMVASSSGDEERSEDHEAIALRKKRMLGSVRFMGELFVRSLLFPYGIIECANCLLHAPVNSDNLELVVGLLTVIGPVFDNPAWLHYAELRSIFWSIRGLTFDPAIATRVRCLLLDLLDLRDASWVDTKVATKVERPKRLEDVRLEVEGKIQKSPSKTLAAEAALGWSAGGETLKHQQVMWPPMPSADDNMGHEGFAGQQGPIEEGELAPDMLSEEHYLWYSVEAFGAACDFSGEGFGEVGDTPLWRPSAVGSLVEPTQLLLSCH